MQLAGLLAMTAIAQSPYGLTLKDGVFEAKALDKTARVSIAQATRQSIFPAERLTLNYGGRRILLDQKGIGIEKGNQVAWSRVPAISTTPKLFTPEQIADTQAKIKSGERDAGFSVLAGYEYVGSTLYLLLQWKDKFDVAWLEAIVGIDMTAEDLTASLVGKMDGISFAKGPVDDQLLLNGGSLVALARGESGWGVASWDLAENKASFQTLGDNATTAKFTNAMENVVSLYATSYGTTIATYATLRSGDSAQVAEVRGPIKGIIEPCFLRYVKGRQPMLVNLSTGIEIEVDENMGGAQSDLGLIVWSPADEPKYAKFIDSASGRVYATWTSVASGG